MLRDVVSFDRLWERLHGRRGGATLALVRFLERRVGARMYYDRSRIPFGRDDLADLFELGAALKERGVIRQIFEGSRLPDEPPLKQWMIECVTHDHHVAGGVSQTSDRAALTAALAEATERTIWYERSDHLRLSTLTSVAARARGGIEIASIAGLDTVSDKAHGARYRWTSARSVITGKPVLIPAQLVSGIAHKEPLLRSRITTGLATWPTSEGAILRGALEIIERDAFMLMWLNQLTLPQLDLQETMRPYPETLALLERCERYRLTVHVVPLITDAPTHVFMAVVVDSTGNQPRYALGLKAGQRFGATVEGAILEALRAREGTRKRGPLKADVAHKDIGHFERLAYWADEKHATGLQFLVEGPQTPHKSAAWEHESDDAHLARIRAWCAANEYELASVSLTKSPLNATPWHIEMVVIPQLQPLYLHERQPHIHGRRIADVPRAYGYEPRKAPYTDAPHPFA